MSEETMDSLKKRLAKQQEAHGQDLKQLSRMQRVIDVLIAAGYLDRYRYEKAEALVDDLKLSED